MKELKKIIGRAITSVFIWVIFAGYFLLNEQTFDVAQTLLLAMTLAIIFPYMVEWMYETFNK